MLEVTRPDGTKLKHVVKWRHTEPASAEGQIVEQLASLADLPDLRSLPNDEG
jgi:hypothetical protein